VSNASALIELSDINSLQDDQNRLRKYLKSRLGSAKEQLTEKFNNGVSADTLVHQNAEMIDALLIQTWQIFFKQYQNQIALVAVGGYGRGELHPGSDIDLAILVTSDASACFPVIEQFITLLWDIGLEVGNTVRTIEQCIEAAQSDITVATNLMEARLLSGNQSLFDEMKSATSPENIWPVNEFFEAKWKEQIARHHKYNDTAYNLEPNIKEGPGGLRDIQMIGWVAKRHFGATTLHDLVKHGFLNEKEFNELNEGQNFLWRIRYGLHVITNRREDRLLFDHQRTLAKMFGFKDDKHNLSVEIFMKQYYRAIMGLNRLNEMLLQLFEEAILLTADNEQTITINSRFQVRCGFIEISSENVFKKYPFALLEIFLILQQHQEIKGVRATTIRAIRDHRYLIDEKFRSDLRCRSLFMEIIRQPAGITNELRRMNQYGILAAYLPIFGHIVGQMQHDLFHVYTVDEHTLFVVRNLRRFAIPEYSHELPMCSELYEKLPKSEILYMAGLFHDIAKGRGGDHSELGAVDAYDFCRHHGMSEYDADLVAWLVRNHLLLSQTSQKEDISDPEVIKRFASKINSLTHLHYLYLLTVADIRATNPSLWNSWKAALLVELYSSCASFLQHGSTLADKLDERILQKQQQAIQQLKTNGVSESDITQLWQNLDEDYFSQYSSSDIIWHTETLLAHKPDTSPLIAIRTSKERGGTEIFVHTPDAHHLFAGITYTLARFGLDVVGARIYTGNSGDTFDSYNVLEENGNAIDNPQRVEAIRMALQQQIIDGELRPGDISRQTPRQLKYFHIPTEVNFRKDAHEQTVMEVITTDKPGLLSRIAMALAECHVTLRNARVTTFGERVEDTFLITDNHYQTIDDPQKLNQLREKIIGFLENK